MLKSAFIFRHLTSSIPKHHVTERKKRNWEDLSSSVFTLQKHYSVRQNYLSVRKHVVLSYVVFRQQPLCKQTLNHEQKRDFCVLTLVLHEIWSGRCVSVLTLVFYLLCRQTDFLIFGNGFSAFSAKVNSLISARAELQDRLCCADWKLSWNGWKQKRVHRVLVLIMSSGLSKQ